MSNWFMIFNGDPEKIEKMIGSLEPLESNLHKHLTEHLNAEVVLQTITDLHVAMCWLQSTFLYIRAKKNPRYYGIQLEPSSEQIDKKLFETCQIELNKLVRGGMLTMDHEVFLHATPLGCLMAKYYLAFETMKLFTQMNGDEILPQILVLISKCQEFSEMYLRVDDKKCLNLLNSNKRNCQSIRFPLNGKIKTLHMKINCIIQAVLGSLDIVEHSILTETLKIMRNGERIVKCLIEYLESKEKHFTALLNTVIMAKCFHVKLWENSPYVSKQLPGIGIVMSSQLVTAGKITFQLLSESDPREIEMILSKRAPVGNRILEQVNNLPKYTLKLEKRSTKCLALTVSLLNALDLESNCTVKVNSLMSLLVGDSFNNVLLYEKYSHSYMIQHPDVTKIIEIQQSNVEEVEAHFISEDWVGIDCSAKFELIKKKSQPATSTKSSTISTKSSTPAKSKVAKQPTANKQKSDGDVIYMQTFMEAYMKHKKSRPVEKINPLVVDTLRKEDSNNNKKKDLPNKQIIIHSDIRIANSNDNEKPEKKPLEKFNENASANIRKPKYCLSPDNSESQQFKLNDDNKTINVDDGVAVCTPIKKKFKCTPKQFTHDGTLNGTQPSAFCTPVAMKAGCRSMTQDNVKSHLRISWRQPLIYSPPVKFSPKINYKSPSSNKIELSSTLSETTTSSSHLANVNLDTSLRTVMNTSQVLTSRPASLSTYFPLLDDHISERQNDLLNYFSDVVSHTFLEDMGLKPPKLRKLNSQAGDYYIQMVSEPEVHKKRDQQKVLTPKNTSKAVNVSTYWNKNLKSSFVNDKDGKNLTLKGDRNSLSVTKTLEAPKQSPYFQSENRSNEISRIRPKELKTNVSKFLIKSPLTSTESDFSQHSYVERNQAIRKSGFSNEHQFITNSNQNNYPNSQKGRRLDSEILRYQSNDELQYKVNNFCNQSRDEDGISVNFYRNPNRIANSNSDISALEMDAAQEFPIPNTQITGRSSQQHRRNFDSVQRNLPVIVAPRTQNYQMPSYEGFSGANLLRKRSSEESRFAQTYNPRCNEMRTVESPCRKRPSTVTKEEDLRSISSQDFPPCEDSSCYYRSQNSLPAITPNKMFKRNSFNSGPLRNVMRASCGYQNAVSAHQPKFLQYTRDRIYDQCAPTDNRDLVRTHQLEENSNLYENYSNYNHDARIVQNRLPESSLRFCSNNDSRQYEKDMEMLRNDVLREEQLDDYERQFLESSFTYGDSPDKYYGNVEDCRLDLEEDDPFDFANTTGTFKSTRNTSTFEKPRIHFQHFDPRNEDGYGMEFARPQSQQNRYNRPPSFRGDYDNRFSRENTHPRYYYNQSQFRQPDMDYPQPYRSPGDKQFMMQKFLNEVDSD